MGPGGLAGEGKTEDVGSEGLFENALSPQVRHLVPERGWHQLISAVGWGCAGGGGPRGRVEPGC